ncbi:hypothetical protein M8J75_002931 [Diaphorina citri]|nr:hypothetical protein M8J75_002931 [Diaphorina citri]
MYNRGNSMRSIIIASAYFPYDSPSHPPTLECAQLVEFSELQNLDILLGVDANAHSESWGSTDTNPRGESLLNYLLSKRLIVLNEGCEPTFMTRARAEVIDITVASPTLTSQIERWHVMDEPSLSDHRYIYLEVSGVDRPEVTYRNPRKTNWTLYRQLLESELSQTRTVIRNTDDIEDISNDLSSAINTAYGASCPVVGVLNKKTCWWTSELSRLRTRTRRLFNRAKGNNDWGSYHQALKDYNKAIRTAKRAGWRNLCQEIDKTSEAARLQKIMAKEPITLGTIKKPNGEWTQSGKETLETLIEAHFPGSETFDYSVPSDTVRSGTPHRRPQKNDWKLAKSVVTHKKLEWAIGTFQPFKAAGNDAPLKLRPSSEAGPKGPIKTDGIKFQDSGIAKS